jgi:molybdenum cofactor cytidylyltransferase
MTVACAILAAGASKRLGHPKQLASLSDGRGLLRRVAETATSSRAASIAVVLDANAEPVARAVDGLPLDVLASEDASEGIAASIRTAATWARERGAAALLLCACDQPLLEPRHLNVLIATFEQERCPVASYYAGRAGVPALFPAAYFASLRELRGDTGASKLLRAARHLALVGWPEGEHDVDTAADLARASAYSAPTTAEPTLRGVAEPGLSRATATSPESTAR